MVASGNDDDINDVACMAGVNLQVGHGHNGIDFRYVSFSNLINLGPISRDCVCKVVKYVFIVVLQEEQSKILATNSEILNLQLRSCKDSYFLNNKVLQKQIENIGECAFVQSFVLVKTPLIPNHPPLV